MPRITKVYTRTGDDGTTALSDGKRLPKDDLQVECYGTVDELNSSIGLVVASGPSTVLRDPLSRIQNELFHLGAQLSSGEGSEIEGPKVTLDDAVELERLMDELSDSLTPLENFVLPGGTVAASHLHLARTICRRAERLAVTLARRESLDPAVVTYLNRLSDTLFVMARFDNAEHGVEDVLWDSRA